MSSNNQQLVLNNHRDHLQKLQADGQDLKKLTEAGLIWLRTNQQIVNALNVFPVPDGDTGINMVLTMQSAYDEIITSGERNAGKIIHSIAHGALMGARGNSGVILSQIWRGFARVLGQSVTLDAETLVKAFAEARDTAYKGVVRPVEGTILTVAKDIATAAEDVYKETDDLVSMLAYIVNAADESVERTPDLLDVLREAGVVDAGGKGLFYILEGMLRFILDQPLDTALTSIQPLASLDLENALETLEPGQDFEVVVDFSPHDPLDLDDFYRDLEKMGTSIQLGEGDGIYRMHIHVPTEKLYEPTNYIMSIGSWTRATFENLIAQMEEIGDQGARGKLKLATVEPGQIAVVAVSPGAGISRVFAGFGVAAIVEGGQTMNPSTQDILNSFEDLPTNQIIILPNNKNIFMAAKASADLSVKNVAVIPSNTIPQGISAMIRLIPSGNFDDVVINMNEAIDDVETGEITTATRSVEIDGVDVKEGQIIALHNGKMVLSASNLEDACLGLLKKIHAEDFEIIALFNGANTQQAEVNHIVDCIRKAYPKQEIEHKDGGQPHYHFIISIE